MDRRAFLTARRSSLKRQPDSVLHTARTTSGLTPYAGPWTAEEVVHLLKRTMFGANPDDVAYFSARTMSQAVDELLNPVAALPSPPVKDYTGGDAVAAGATWVNDYTTDADIDRARRASFKKWGIGLMINQDRSIREKITLFWHNHFATESVTIDNSQLLYAPCAAPQQCFG
jgi:uncharacterized protein (DUF1800 family)